MQNDAHTRRLTRIAMASARANGSMGGDFADYLGNFDHVEFEKETAGDYRAVIEGVEFRPENHITIFILGVVTFGFYYLFLVHKWIKAINSASKKDFFDPTLACVITLFTLGFAALYFDYQILTKASQISRATGVKDNPKRKSLKAPSSNIRETVLAAGIFLSILSFTGALTVITILGCAYLNMLIHQSLEYTFCVHKNDEPSF